MKRDAALLGFLFLVSRIATLGAGVQFDDSSLDSFYQLLDRELLQGELLRSLAHLHSQPPLFNALVGGGLKLGGGDTTILALFYALLGLLTVLSVHRLMLRFEVPRGIAFALATLFLLSPALLLYENFLFYPLPTAAWLAGGAYLLHRYVKEDHIWDGFGAFFCFAGASLTRSLFHWVWFLVVLGLVVAALRGRRRRTWWAAALPTALVLGWSLRTLLMFGTFGPSTWLGMNFAKITLQMGPMRERVEMVREGTLSPIAAIPPFRDLDRYEKLITMSPKTGVRALDNAKKSSGRRNLNHLAYVEVSRLYAEECLRSLRLRPEWYWEGVRTAMRNSFYPTSGGQFVEENRNRIVALTRAYAPLYAGSNFVAMFLFAIVVLGGMARVGWGVWRGRLGEAGELTSAVLVFTIAWVFLAGNFLDVGENYRFRFLTLPAQIVVGAGLLGWMWRLLRRQ